MKTILTTIFLLHACLTFSQSKLDSLSKVHSEQIKSKELIEREIEETEKKLITDILQNGYQLTIKTSYKGATYDLLDMSGYKTIFSLKDGDNVNVIGVEGIYLVVEYADTIGKVFLTKLDTPLTILMDFKYRDFIKSTQNHHKVSSSNQPTKTNYIPPPIIQNTKTNETKPSNCSSSQCTGTTQKKTRCKNMTTNCNGRCHLH